VPAAEALELGLVNRVVADAELAQRLAAGPTLAYARTRRLVRQSLETGLGNQLEDEADAIISMARTDDFREGVTAFVEKRKPRFTGR
jgi:2-(1,2-epoxy-1,2-dihydrophenyl)acetyl-CoA isomerase